MLMIENIGNLYCIGENKFHEMFLQYIYSWAWWNVSPTKIFGSTISGTYEGKEHTTYIVYNDSIEK